MERTLKKQFSIESETKSPFFYFETSNEIIVYHPNKGGYTICSSLSKEFIQDLAAFKMEYLSEAIELIEKPKDKLAFVISQE